jgi:predicted lipid-binding transport protein (Tim44 family)
MFASSKFRLAAVLATLLLAFSMLGVGTAEARFGGSFGSRGTRTFQSVPSTRTVPSYTAPVQRTMTNGQTSNPGVGATQRPGMFGGGLFGGGLGGWLLGGLLFSGLFGMMAGTGFGGFGGAISLLIQLVVVGFVVRWLFNRFGRTQTAGGYGGSNYSYASPPQGGSQAGGSYGGASATSRRAGGHDEIGVTDADLRLFEQRLGQLQDAYSREDYDALRRISTPEVMSYLTEELAQSAAKGLRNEVFDVRLIQGDVAEGWREGDHDYATVAMRYESRDVMRDRATGALVSGEDSLVERSEVWTFTRVRGGDWLLSAIQGA